MTKEAIFGTGMAFDPLAAQNPNWLHIEYDLYCDDKEQQGLSFLPRYQPIIKQTELSPEFKLAQTK